RSATPRSGRSCSASATPVNYGSKSPTVPPRTPRSEAALALAPSVRSKYDPPGVRVRTTGAVRRGHGRRAGRAHLLPPGQRRGAAGVGGAREGAGVAVGGEARGAAGRSEPTVRTDGGRGTGGGGGQRAVGGPDRGGVPGRHPGVGVRR